MMDPETFSGLLDAGARMLDNAKPVEQCGPESTGEATRQVVAQLRAAVQFMDLMKAWGPQEAALRARAAALVARFEQRANRLEGRRMS